jgi:alpha-galactosidase
MKPEILEILTNKEVIAVDQDKLGKQGFRWYGDSVYEIWLKFLSDGDLAVCVMNVTEEERDISITWSHIGEVPKNAAVRDLWQHKDLGNVADMPTFSRKIGPHDVAMLRFVVEKSAK